MAGTKLVHINRHSTVNADAYVGVEGEVTMDTGTRELRTHDGVAAGGNRILTKTQNDLTYQPKSVDLTALASFGAATGIIAHVAINTFVLRTFVAPAAGLTITNSDAVAGNPTFVLANDLAALEGLGSTGFAARIGTDSWAQRTLTAPASGMTITNPAGIAGNPTFAFANDLAGVEGLAGTGIAARTAADTWTTRTITGPAAGIGVTNGDGVAGNPTLALANDLAGVEGLTGTGFAVRTAADTWTNRSLTAPAAGFTITNNDAVAGNPTFVLANDLAGLEGLAGTGFAVRTTTDTWANRSITSTGGSITITNPAGIAGNINLEAEITGLTAATPAQSDPIAHFNTVAGTNRKVAIAGAANSLVNIAAASRAQAQTGTDNTTIVTPARVIDSPFAAKAWCIFDGTTVGTNAPTAGQGVTSITRNSAGDYTITFSTAFTTANYVVVIMPNHQAANQRVAYGIAVKTTTTYRFQTSDTATTVDTKEIMIVAFGVQA